MSKDITLVVDVMSGDIEPRLCVLACIKFVKLYEHVQVIIVGFQDVIEPILPPNTPRIQILACNEVVAMSDSPSTALRHKKQSSMFKAIGELANKHADACVSAGNTGALLAIGKHLLGQVEGVTRPAIAKAMPTVSGSCIVLDLGANIDCSAEQLVEFALMGSALAQAQRISSAKIALLSNGEEPTKGNKEIKRAAALLEAHESLNYVGFIEGDKVFNDPVDVVVCDGFVGNIALKVSEGASRFIAHDLALKTKRSVLSRMIAYIAKPLLSPWLQKFQPDNYNGAAFVGLNSVLVKSHGNASEAGFMQALEVAFRQVQGDVPAKLRAHFAHLSRV